jgi:alpha-1,6-mannosyltransferase
VRRPPPAVAGLTGAVLVAAGGLVTSVVPASSWIGAIGLRASMPGRMAGLAVVVAGLGLMVRAWLAIGRSLLADPIGWRHRVNRIAALWSAPLLLGPPLFSRDAWSYAAQGAMVAEGFDPYAAGPGVLSGRIVEAVDPMWLWTPAPYGPIPLWYGGLAARVTLDPYLLMLAHRLLAVLGLWLIAISVPRIAAACRANPSVTAWLVVANPLTIAHGVGAAHNDLLMIGLACYAVTHASAGRWGTAAVLAGTAAAVKLPGGLVVIAIAAVMSPLAARVRTRVASLVIAGTVALVSLATIGELTGVGSGWAGALGVPGRVRSPFSIANLAGLGTSGLLEWLGLEGPAGHAFAAVRLAGIVAALGLVAVLAVRSSVHHAVRGTGIALLAVVLLGPTAHDWYFLWCLPFLAAARPGRRLTTVLVGVSVILTIAAPLNSSLRGALVPIVVTTSLVVLVAGALLGRVRTLQPDSTRSADPHRLADTPA